MADLATYLARLDRDTLDVAAWDEIVAAMPRIALDAATGPRLAEARGRLLASGHVEEVRRLLELEIAAIARAPNDATNDAPNLTNRHADLLVEHALLVGDEFADSDAARTSLDQALALRPDDELAAEALSVITEQADNWQRLADKYVAEAKASSDRQLATSMFVSAASLAAQYNPTAADADQYLRAALAVDPRNRRAAQRLERRLRAAKRTTELAELLTDRTANGATIDEQVAAWIGLAELRAASAPDGLDDAAGATEALRAAINLNAGHPTAVRLLAADFEARRDWAGRVALYQGALRARGDDDAAILLQLGNILWRDFQDDEQAEEYFRRLRRIDPSQPDMLDFYRAYYTSRGDSGKLMTLLRTADRSRSASNPPPVDQSGGVTSPARTALAVEIAELAESQIGADDKASAEKAIEAWKQVLRADSFSVVARAALQRLYRRTEKWNALLDIIKDDVEHLADGNPEKLVRLFEMVEIYRDRLKLDGMVINTYGSILRIEPDNLRAIDEMAERFLGLSRWNDLINTLARKAELPTVPEDVRINLQGEIAGLWIERFGNYAQAIRPLERVLELAAPGSASALDAITRLKDIHTRRRQWRQLVGLLGLEVKSLTGAARREKLAEMARLTMERAGDLRLAIEVWNQLLAEQFDADSPDEELQRDLDGARTALVTLYEREKRWPALLEILRQQRARAATAAEAITLLERQGNLLVDRFGADGAASARLSAQVWQEILDLDPSHARALRALREALAAANDFDGLEALYTRLGHVDDLVDTFVALADRSDDKALRLALLERGAALASQRAQLLEGAVQIDALDRAARVWERVVAVAPGHVAASRALAESYERTEKWPRLVPALEGQLAGITDDGERLALVLRIRDLCEQKLGSRAMAFGWAIRSVELAPARADLRAVLLRLAHDPESLREAAQSLEDAARSQAVSSEDRVTIFRELAEIYATKLADPERARACHHAVLGLVASDSREAAATVAALEELAIRLSDWQGLVASLRSRADAAAATPAAFERRLAVAVAEEERLADLDAAARSYEQALQLAQPGDGGNAGGVKQALRALVRLHEARGDWEALSQALRLQLDGASPAEQAKLYLRIGTLEERDLGKPQAALDNYARAYELLISPSDPTASSSGDGAVAFAAVERRLLDNTVATDDPTQRRLAELLLPAYETRRDSHGIARCLELLRQVASADVALAYDRRLLVLHTSSAPDPARAWTAGLRILAAAPADDGVRHSLDKLAGELGRDGEFADALGRAHELLVAQNAAPSDLKHVAAERARLHGNRLGNRDGADAAWRQVLAVAPADDEAFGQLAASHRLAERWQELRELLGQRIDASVDEATQLSALFELATLEEDVLVDPVAAIATFRRVLDLAPGHDGAQLALDRLFTATSRWRELDDLLAVQQSSVEGSGAKRISGPSVDLRFRRADLYATKLLDLRVALDLVEEVLERQPQHAGARALLASALSNPDIDSNERLRAARILEPMYRREQRYAELVTVLEVQRHVAVENRDTHTAREISIRIAELHERDLADAVSAFTAWSAVLLESPTDERPRQAVPRLAGILGRWPEATATFEQAYATLDDHEVAARTELLTELAQFYDEQQDDDAQAITTYRRLLDADLHNPENNRIATTALARLYEQGEKFSQLRDVLRLRVGWVDDGGERRTLLAKIAELEEHALDNRDGAIAAWRELLVDNPEDVSGLASLERLYELRQQWPELIDILRRRIDIATAGVIEPSQIKELLSRIADIHERALNSPNDAISSHLEILDYVPADAEALTSLARLYRGSERFDELLDVQERRLESQGRSSELLADVAAILDGPLGRRMEGLERWAELLAIEPSHRGATAAVEQAIGDPDRRSRAAKILRPLYTQLGDESKLEMLAVQLANSADNPRERMVSWSEVASRREQRLGNLSGAFDAAVEALKAAVAEPEAGEVATTVERLAGQLDREGELVDIYRQVAPEILDAELQRRLYLDVADLARGVTGDLVVAREFYQRVLDAQPEDRRATLALESLYRSGAGAPSETGDVAGRDDERLYETLIRKADLSWVGHDERTAALAEAAALAGGPLARPHDAMVAWEQVLEAEPRRHDAADALEVLYRAQSRHVDLVELYERQLGFVTNIAEAVSLQVRLAAVHANELHDPNAAMESYGAALSGDPDNAVALAAVEKMLDDPQVRAEAASVLEPIYVSRQAWPELIRVSEVKYAAATEPDERLRLTRFLARLHEEQLEDFEQASQWYARLFRELPADASVREQLGRLANIVENWSFVADVYQQFLTDEPGLGPDSEAGPGAVVRDVALAVGALYDRRLNDPSRAQIAYRRALGIPYPGSEFGVPDEREVLRRLESVLERSEQFATLVEVYDEVLTSEAGNDDAFRREVTAKKARVLELRVDDPARAIDAWREQVLATADIIAPPARVAHLEAVTELERLYRARAQWFDLTELLSSQLESPSDDSDEIELRLRLAEVLEQEQQDVPAAIDQLEIVLGINTGLDRALPPLERLVLIESHRQRIVELLEPIYRTHDWWQKLVVVLDAKLAYVEDPIARVNTLREISRIHEERGGDPSLSRMALARAWRVDVSDTEVQAELINLASIHGSWDELIETLEAGVNSTFEPDVVAGTWASIATIYETRRDDVPSAIASLRKVVEARPDDGPALASLDRLLAATQQHAELVAIVERRAELASNVGVRLVLLHRAAAIYEEILAKPRAAIGAYRQVLELDPDDVIALEGLTRLYATGGEGADPHELADVLRRQIELASDVAARRPLRLQLAQVHEVERNDDYEAIAQLSLLHAEDGRDLEALAGLDRLYAKLGQWPELLDIIDQRILLEPTVEGRAAHLMRAAGVVERELVDIEAAVPRYTAVLQFIPDHGEARQALWALAAQDDYLAMASAVLEQNYRALGDADGLIRVHERRLAAPVDDAERRRLEWSALADVHEIMRHDERSAFDTWARAIADDPNEMELMAPLERLAISGNRFADLAEVVSNRRAAANVRGDAQLEHAYAMRLGAIREDALGDVAAAREAFEQAAATGIDQLVAFAALERVAARASDWPAMADVLERAAVASDQDGASADFWFRLGELREIRIGDPLAAALAFREALARNPVHGPARASMLRLVRVEPPVGVEVRQVAVDALEPLLQENEHEGDASDLVDVVVARRSLTNARFDRAALSQRLTELAQTQLGDKGRALAFAYEWLADDPASVDALAEIERLVVLRGAWAEHAAQLSVVAESCRGTDDDARRILLVALGETQVDRLGDLDSSARSLEAARELSPDSLTILSTLVRIHRGRGDAAALAEVQWRRGELSTAPAERAEAFAEVAKLREAADDLAGAATAWSAAADADGGANERTALEHLAAVHEKAGDLPAMIATLSRISSNPRDDADDLALRLAIARLQTGSDGVRAWESVLDVADRNEEALSALEILHASAGDFGAVADLIGRRLANADTLGERVLRTIQLAKLAENQRDAPDDAISHWYAVLDLDGSCTEAYEQLDRLLQAQGRHHDVVELLERRAELEATRGDHVAELRALAQCADIWEGPLDDAVAAGEVLEKILRRDPTSVPALTRLSRLHARAAEWEKCTAVLQQALALGPTGRDAAELFYRLAEVARDHDRDPSTARAHLEQALRSDPDHEPSLIALEQDARATGDDHALSALLRRRAERLPADVPFSRRLELIVELAELERKLGRPEAGLPLLEQAQALSPDDVGVLGPLADLYAAAGQGHRAAPLYQRLADEARAARRMKDVARYRQRQGALLETAGDSAGAAAAYDEAFRVNPTDTATMAGLGRLAMAMNDYEKARKVYRSLVLQNIDESAGISKGDVYLALGQIHLALGEAIKARGMFQRGLETEPAHPGLREAMAALT